MKLNLCSGPSLFPPPWHNLDREDQTEYIRILREDCTPEMLATWPSHQRILADQAQSGPIHFECRDVRWGLPWIDDDSVDAIYWGQAIEHFNPNVEIPKLLAECRRILKPRGKLRITTPDLDLLIGAYRANDMMRFASEQPEFYVNADPSAQLAYIMYGSSGPKSTYDAYDGHQFLFTRRSLARMLNAAGLTEHYFNGPRSAEFEGTVDCGMSHSLSVEATK